jgi:hypothetical protein
MMADIILLSKTKQVSMDFAQPEEAKIIDIGRIRSHYQKLAGDVESNLV